MKINCPLSYQSHTGAKRESVQFFSSYYSQVKKDCVSAKIMKDFIILVSFRDVRLKIQELPTHPSTLIWKVAFLSKLSQAPCSGPISVLKLLKITAIKGGKINFSVCTFQRGGSWKWPQITQAAVLSSLPPHSSPLPTPLSSLPCWPKDFSLKLLVHCSIKEQAWFHCFLVIWLI